MDFKFCTDRRMTAYVLGTRPRMRENIPDKSLGKSKNDNVHSGSDSPRLDIPILAVGNDELHYWKRLQTRIAIMINALCLLVGMSGTAIA